jgi:hypothetical protein
LRARKRVKELEKEEAEEAAADEAADEAHGQLRVLTDEFGDVKRTICTMQTLQATLETLKRLSDEANTIDEDDNYDLRGDVDDLRHEIRAFARTTAVAVIEKWE